MCDALTELRYRKGEPGWLEHTSLLHALVGSAVLLEAIVLAGLVGVRHGDCFEF